ncbi:MAG: NADH-quinone oxidoreductase subunit NuoH [Ardenticatenaceae bacterium]|nr:NADH-quinone oxidoreductase subunit NuoH [Ardenticatenaceae bacterium]
MNAESAGQLAWITLVVGGIITFAVITGFAYTTLLERKVLARLQHRVGPNRAGYVPIPRRGKKERRLLGGFMQPAADAVKLFMKEDITPIYVDNVVYNLAPMLTVMPVILTLAVIPWASSVTLFGIDYPYLAIAPGLNVALLFVLAITSIEVYGVVLAGWSSNSKYAVLGGIRSTAQMISYELALGLTLLVPVMIAGSLNLNDIIVSQQETAWFTILQLPASIVFFVAALAEMQRAPFDLLEAEQELSSGYNVEYAGMRFAMFFMAEYMKMIVFSALWVVLFLGGYDIPFINEAAIVSSADSTVVTILIAAGQVLSIILKIVFSLFLMIWIRASWPRLRYDQLMDLGWKTLLPISLLNVIVTGVMIVLAEEGVFNSLISAFGG